MTYELVIAAKICSVAKLDCNGTQIYYNLQKFFRCRGSVAHKFAWRFILRVDKTKDVNRWIFNSHGIIAGVAETIRDTNQHKHALNSGKKMSEIVKFFFGEESGIKDV